MAIHNEQDLLLRANRFDPSALALAYELFSPAIYRYAYHLLGDPHLAEECLAETFKRFLQSINRSRAKDQYEGLPLSNCS